MKKIVFTLLILGVITTSYAQGFLLEDDFDYPMGAMLRDHGWTPHSAGATNPLLVGSTPLALSNTPYIGGGIGRAAHIDNTGSDENKPFSTDVDSGSVYAAFLMKPGAEVTSDGTGFFFHFVTYSNPSNPDPTSISTAFRARTFIVEGSDPGFFRLGLNFNAAAAPNNVGVDLTSDLDTSETYLVVVKYTFIPGDDNDEVSLFVFEDGDDISTEPSIPTLGPYGGTASDASVLQAVALRQYNSDQNIIVDGIRVRTDWDFESNNVSVRHEEQNREMSVYPNPLIGNTLFIESSLAEQMNCVLYDLTGKIVFKDESVNNQILLPNLTAGLYMLHVTQNGRVSTHKVVVQ